MSAVIIAVLISGFILVILIGIAIWYLMEEEDLFDIGEEEGIVTVLHGDEAECGPDECSFVVWPNKSCTDKNDFSTNTDTTDECLRYCLDDDRCLSVEYGIEGSSKEKDCHLSYSCNDYNFTMHNDYDMYVKI